MEDQEELVELIRKRRAEIAANAQEVFKAVEMGTAKRGSFEDLKAYLLDDLDIKPQLAIAGLEL
jgi:hypothetical protein